jgi:broad specificity phosphatase PhoE/ribonuclease HI
MSGARRLKVIVEADGGSRGNPGVAGYGAVVLEATTGEVLIERAAAIGVATNNVAEYSGLIAGLSAAAELGAVEVEARMDSKLVVEQMSGRWQIKHPSLRPLAARVAALVARFDIVRFTWIPRERNKRADALANAAMDGKPAPESAPRVEPASRVESPPRVESIGSWAPPVSRTATRLVLVRHGETEYTASRRYSGRGDVPLSARGLAQAEATAPRVATAAGQAAVVLSSPLRRCTRTAEAIAEAVGRTPLVVEPALIECDFGEWEGLTFAEVRERWPARLDEWLASNTVAPPGGESFDEVGTRVRGLVSRVLSEYAEQTVVLVSHVTPIKLVLRDALNGGESFLHRLYLDPAGISIVDSWPDSGVAVRTVNDTAHLTTVV